MAIDEKRIESIVSEVLERLEAGPGAARGAAPLGVHPDLDTAVAAARQAFAVFDRTPLATRYRIVTAVRETMLANLRVLAEIAVRETGLGRVDDKILKNRLVAEKTPGIEDLEPVTWTGDHGLTLAERAPYGVIAVITPVTNPTETIINNGISMVAGGNVAVFCPHPSARQVSTLTIDLFNRAAMRSGSPMPLLHSVAEPTIEVAQTLLHYPGIRLNVVTGGPGVVREAMAAGKKAITAGPGNPPTVVDETADLERAARDLVMGASLDNNIICTDEKEVIAVALIADRLKEAFARSGAIVLQPHQTERLRALVLEKEQGPRKHAAIKRRFVGRNIDVILAEAGIPCDPSKRIALCEVDARPSVPVDRDDDADPAARARAHRGRCHRLRDRGRARLPPHRLDALPQHRQALEDGAPLRLLHLRQERPERRRPRVRRRGPHVVHHREPDRRRHDDGAQLHASAAVHPGGRVPDRVMHVAIAAIETSSIAQGAVVGDAMVKTAEVDLLEAAMLSPGKYWVLIGGEVATVRAAYRRGLEVAAETLLDSLFIPQLHEMVVPALRGVAPHADHDALGVLETMTAAAAIVAADRAAKAANVLLRDIRLANGLGGKGVVLLTGTVGDVQAAIESGRSEALQKGLLARSVVVPRLAAQMKAKVF